MTWLDLYLLLLGLIACINWHFALKTAKMWEEDRDWWKKHAEELQEELDKTYDLK